MFTRLKRRWNRPARSITIEAFISATYLALLERNPTHWEVTHWSAVLVESEDPASIAKEIALSDEAQGIAGTRHPYLFAPLGHFSNPIADPSIVKDHYSTRVNSLQELRALPGLSLDGEKFRACLPEIAGHFRQLETLGAFNDYAFTNGSFSWGDTITYSHILAKYQPNRIFEVGSGYSTQLAINVLDSLGLTSAAITCVEPFPQLLDSLVDVNRLSVMAEPLEPHHIESVSALQSGDILFIDSTHVAKSGSDVLLEMLHMIPTLNDGVLIHIHDIFWPFEYPYEWAVTEKRNWNEIYLVHALLIDNPSLEVVFFNDWVQRFLRDDLQRLIPEFLNNPGGSLWLRRQSD